MLKFRQLSLKKFKESKMSDKTEVPDKSKTSDKFEKFLAGGDIILNCLISDEGVNDNFEVTISNANDNRVSSLANEIINCRLDRFQDIDSTSLALYKIAFITDTSTYLFIVSVDGCLRIIDFVQETGTNQR
ncbi:hypothetical protein GLOIN_2v1523116 [Rhizophagus clarus]|uniref:Crinkler effector protein N-terminal domain-containing protein n=1 Tax=Rhizophagus clarus TaxID=94130 RepID=A0A8H3QCW6_9GLOM|nr:hypothetical protein GLOIN_2v1523116 [Rhizophagus clarus]